MFSLLSFVLARWCKEEKTTLKQSTALEAFVALAVSPHKKLVHHAPPIYAVLHDHIGGGFGCVRPRNQLDSTHSTYEEMSGFFKTLGTCVAHVSSINLILL